LVEEETSRVEENSVGEIGLGWRIPEFPVDGARGRQFVDQILRSLEVVEESFDSAWLSDHMIPWTDWQNPDTDSLEGWTTINYLTGVFKRLSFGHIVLCNSYRNPPLLAKMAATLSLFAPGRFILGIGAGWKMDEYLSYGYEFAKASDRIEALVEAVQIIRKMWTESVVYFHGKHYNVAGAYCFPKPSPVPPIMIGGGGEKLLLRVVASYADWWNGPNLAVEEYRHKLDVLKRHCEEVGTNYEAIKKTWTGCIAIAKTQKEALQIAKENPFSAIPGVIIGTPEQISQRLAEFVELGVRYFIFRFLDFPKMKGIELFAEKVAGKL
jgi:alkanesulfonate monooxygenase SsuD/methylene tetrahydromethanopterin reductase-like flavin-dependent oxidoreductase (luciferase family)